MGNPRGAEVLATVLVPVVFLGAAGSAALGLWAAFIGGLGGTTESERINGYLVTALAIGVVGPVVGLILARGGELRAVRVLHGVILAGTLLCTAVSCVEWSRDGVDQEPRSPVPACQEHSGGDSTCPGG